VSERIYRDPVHNIIRLRTDTDEGRLMVRLIDSFEFQRLRRIKQLGLALYTYQGAEHSRFAHSLGVLHLMTRVLDRLGELYDISDEDRAAARALARRVVALYLPVVARLDPTMNDPEWLARIKDSAARNDYDTVAADISDEVLDRFAFAGAPSDLIEHAEQIAAAGATRIEFGTPHGLDSADGIRVLGERVLPQLARLGVGAR